MKRLKIACLVSIASLYLIILGLASCIHNTKPSGQPDKNIYINNLQDDVGLTQEEIALIVSDMLKRHDTGAPQKSLQILHPYDNAVFPKDIAAPLFSWESPDIYPKIWVIKIELPAIDSTIFTITNKTSWVPDKATWDFVKKNSVATRAALTVFGYNITKDKLHNCNKIYFSTSEDNVGAPIVYQQMMIPIGVGSQFPNSAKWLIGDVSSYKKPKIILENQNVCGMCHHFSADGKAFGLDLDVGGDKGSYGITDVKKKATLKNNDFISWTKFQNDDNTTLGLFAKLSPKGKYVISTIKEKRVFIQINDLDFSELFFPYEGVLAYYNRVSDQFFYLPGADDPNYVHVGADWSPDGKYLIFSRAKAKKEFDRTMKDKAFVSAGRLERINDLQDKYSIKYDLYLIPFNNGKGGIPEPLKGAYNNGKSNFWPRYSPNGKWIVFTQSENAMMNQPGSKLYIVPARGGQARQMNCSRKIHNSWHSWSPNSKWLVFSSKVNTPFTEIFLAHVDENGNDSQPVLLTRFNSKKLATVMPEFANIKPGEFEKIIVE